MTSPLEAAWRQLRQAANRNADQLTDDLAELGVTVSIEATVTTVVVGGASDGTNLVKVTWRSGEVTAAGWNASSTFSVGQRVMCRLTPDHQLYVDYVIVGAP